MLLLVVQSTQGQSALGFPTALSVVLCLGNDGIFNVVSTAETESHRNDQELKLSALLVSLKQNTRFPSFLREQLQCSLILLHLFCCLC